MWKQESLVLLENIKYTPLSSFKRPFPSTGRTSSTYIHCCVAYFTSAPAFKHKEREERFPINALSKSLPQLQHPEWPEYLFGCLFYGRTNMSIKKVKKRRSLFSLPLPQRHLHLLLSKSRSLSLFDRLSFCRRFCIVTPEGVERKICCEK